MPSDSLTLLRTAISDRLAADTSFSSAPAVVPISEESGDLTQRITIAIGKLGVLCVVPTPRLAKGEYDTSFMGRCRVDFFENVLLNRKGDGYKTAPELLICAFNLLHGWSPAAGNWCSLVFEDHEFEVKGNAIHHTLLLTSDLLT